MPFICSMASATRTIFLTLFLFAVNVLYAQNDSVTLKTDTLVSSFTRIEAVDTASQMLPPRHSPRTAAIRSALLPGLGQVYNKKYIMIPVWYGVLGYTGWYFFDNLKYYKQLRLGAFVLENMMTNRDSTGYDRITDQNVKLAVNKGRLPELKTYRQRTRREVDYAALYFVLGWALNVMEATVNAHLKSFDVSPNLSLNFHPGYSEMAKTNGVSLVVTIK